MRLLKKMMIFMSSVKVIWNSLKENASSSVGMRSKVLEYKGTVKCVLGYIPITDIKVFQIEIEKDIKIERSWLRKFRGAEIQVLPGKEVNFFSILLLDKGLDEIFILFIEDIVTSLTVVTTSLEAINIIRSKVDFGKSCLLRRLVVYCLKKNNEGYTEN